MKDLIFLNVLTCHYKWLLSTDVVIYSKRSRLYSLKERWFVIQLTLACLRHDCGGRARTHFSTNINCAVDSPAFGEFTKVRIASVREENLTLDESPSWSQYHLCQISKSIMFAYGGLHHRHTALTDGAHRLQTDFHRCQQHMFICRIPSVFQEWSFLLLFLLSFCLRQTEGLAAKTKTQQPKLVFYWFSTYWTLFFLFHWASFICVLWFEHVVWNKSWYFCHYQDFGIVLWTWANFVFIK